MYRTVLPLFVLVLYAVATLAAAQQSPQDRAEIQRVIGAQMDAFKRDDGVAAFSYAAPSIRDIFQTPERFMTMVQRGYQPVYRPLDVQFQELVESQGRLLQKVQVVGPDGRPVMAVYTMQQQPDGSWRIAGCVLVRLDGRAT